MPNLPKLKKDADDLSRPSRRRSWRAALGSAIAAAAVSFGFSSVSPPPAAASIQPAASSVAEIRGSKRPAKLVFKAIQANVRLAQDHTSHESHESHASHESHYSSGG